MQTLYTDQTYNEIHRQLHRRLFVLYAVLAVLLGVFLWAMLTRTEWLAMVFACLAGCFAVFFVDLFCMPLVRYRRLVRTALSGRNHDKTMEFVRAESETSVVEGVTCRGLIFLGDPDKHGSREMLLYWDQEFFLPALESGRTYTVCYTGKNIIGIQSEDA